MTSYLNIIKTTGLIGGVQVLTILLALVKNKVVALIIGRDGIGAFGLYTGFTDMVSSVSGLGMNTSASRQIAKANAEDDRWKISKSIYVLRRAVFLTSLLGSVFVCYQARSISVSLFGTEDKMWAVMLVSSVVIFNGISHGQQALLNGLRQIKSLAMCRVIGAACGTIFTILIVYFLKDDGIPLSLAFLALCNFVTSWWYVRNLGIKMLCPTRKEAFVELKGLLGIGVSFASASMVGSIAAILSRSYIVNNFDIATLGEYMASWNISAMSIGIILAAIGVDFMPRLAALLNNNEKTNQEVNNQIELGVLASCLIVLCVLFFSPIIIALLYTKSFTLASDIIRWQILGVGLRVVAWPFGYVLTSRGMGVRYVTIQSFFFIIEFLLLVLFTRMFGVQGLGVNYFFGYSLYVFVAWLSCHSVTGFKASPLLIKIFCVSFLFQFCAFITYFFINTFLYYLLGVIIVFVYFCWGVYILKVHMKIDIVTKLRSKLKTI